MSNRYKGGVISATPPTTTGGEDGTASGAWTLEQQMQLQAAGLWPAQPTGPWIEDCFSTYLYTGNGSTQTITNGINLSGKGGLIWTKFRSGSFGTQSHGLYDTVRGVNKGLICNTTDAELTGASNTITAFNSNGYTMGADSTYGLVNYANQSYVSWTFREQAKFFDVVTWTGNGVGGRQIAHNLGSVPGCLMVKVLSEAGGWSVWHRAIPGDTNQTGYLSLNSNQEAELNKTNVWAANGITSTYFTASTDSPSNINGSGQTYVAYLFAHNAGGFGATGTDNVISCGSYTGNGSASGPVVTLGYEPQWIIIKNTTSATSWEMYDNMRGVATGGNDNTLYCNASTAEQTSSNILSFTATGFQITNAFSNTNGSGSGYIYIAIRRGPMKVPTVGTTVFSPVTYTGDDTNTNRVITTSFPVDSAFFLRREFDNRAVYDRLRGQGTRLETAYPNTESEAGTTTARFSSNTGMLINYNANSSTNQAGATYVLEAFRRAPSFFDEVCYTGTNVAGLTFSHNLAAVPELMIIKVRNQENSWQVYSATTGNDKALYLNQTAAASSSDIYLWNNTSPTSTQFTLGQYATVNANGATYIAYLFATCPGVSKVGSYTGNGSTQTINCGFTGGARFVLIKRTDSTGGWYVYDTARGMTVLTDPYIQLNASGEFSTLGSVTTVSTGFALNSAILADINVNAGTYIFLAIA